MLVVILVSLTSFGQNGVVEQTNWWSSFDFGSLANIGLTIIASVFATGWASATKKIKQAGTLLIKFADAVEDKKVDANEKTDLAKSAKELFSK